MSMLKGVSVRTCFLGKVAFLQAVPMNFCVVVSIFFPVYRPRNLGTELYETLKC